MNKTTKSTLGNQEIFSRNLSRLMSSTGKTQREVAQAIGVSPSTFCDWLRGNMYPRMDKLQMLAEYFGVNKSDLVEEVYAAKETISKEDQEVLDLFHKVPVKKRELVLSMIRAAVDNL